MHRIVGTGDLWVAEFILAYVGRLSYSVSVMVALVFVVLLMKRSVAERGAWIGSE